MQQPFLEATPDQIRTTLKHFIDVLEILQKSSFARCSVEAIRNAFKWAEVVVSYSKSCEKELMMRICNSFVQDSSKNYSTKLIIETPVELVLRLLLESPVEQIEMNNAELYHEGFKCACATLGPTRTASEIAQILKPRVQRNVLLRHHRVIENATDIGVVNNQLCIMLLKSLLLRQAVGTREFDDALLAVREKVMSNEVSLQLFCNGLVLDKSEIYLYLDEKRADATIIINNLKELTSSAYVARIVLSVGESKILYFLEALSADVVLKLCHKYSTLQNIIEESLIIVGEECICQVSTGNFGMS